MWELTVFFSTFVITLFAIWTVGCVVLKCLFRIADAIF